MSFRLKDSNAFLLQEKSYNKNTLNNGNQNTKNLNKKAIT